MSDLEAICAYIARDSPRYAELTTQRLVAAVERLKVFPESGRVVPELNEPAIREVVASPYRVVYRLGDGVIEIATVFRASRVFPALLES